MANLSEHRKVEETSSVMGGTMEGVMVIDSHKIIRSINPAFERITGYASNEAIGCTPALLKSNHENRNFFREMWEAVNTDGQWEGEVWNRHKNGEINPMWLSIRAVKDAQHRITHYVGVLSDPHLDTPIRELFSERLQYHA